MKFLRWNVEDKVAIVTINRPPANALSRNLITEINEFLNVIENDHSVRVIVLHGKGRFFSAGADIKEFTDLDSKEEVMNLAKHGQQVFERIESFSKPIIAAIHGASLGGGLELAMGCHMRFVTEDAKLGLPEVTLGILPGFAGTQRLPKYVGTAKAAEMMLTGEPITGLEAVQCGLANRAFTADDLLPKTLEIAKKIALKSPNSLSAIIKMLSFSKGQSFYDGVEEESKIFGEIFSTEDAKEGISAFIEKRQPTFNGK